MTRPCAEPTHTRKFPHLSGKQGVVDNQMFKDKCLLGNGAEAYHFVSMFIMLLSHHRHYHLRGRSEKCFIVIDIEQTKSNLEKRETFDNCNA